MKNRAGEYVTNLSGKMEYKSFKPNLLPPNPPITRDAEFVEYFVKAIFIQSDKTGKTKIYSYEEYLNILRKDT